MPFVHHGFNGKTLTTYSVLHGDKFSHLCLDDIHPFTYHEAHTPMYASLRAYAR